MKTKCCLLSALLDIPKSFKRGRAQEFETIAASVGVAVSVSVLAPIVCAVAVAGAAGSFSKLASYSLHQL